MFEPLKSTSKTTSTEESIDGCHKIMKKAQENISDSGSFIDSHALNPSSAYEKAAGRLLDAETSAYTRLLDKYLSSC